MIPTVHRRRTFIELRQHGLKVRHGNVRMTYLASPTVKNGVWDGPRVAYAFSRRFGNAVERNRGRRRLRDAFAQSIQRRVDGSGDETTPGTRHPLNGAFLLSANRGILTASFVGVVADVDRCLNKLSTAGEPV